MSDAHHAHNTILTNLRPRPISIEKKGKTTRLEPSLIPWRHLSQFVVVDNNIH